MVEGCKRQTGGRRRGLVYVESSETYIEGSQRQEAEEGKRPARWGGANLETRRVKDHRKEGHRHRRMEYRDPESGRQKFRGKVTLHPRKKL